MTSVRSPSIRRAPMPARRTTFLWAETTPGAQAEWQCASEVGSREGSWVSRAQHHQRLPRTRIFNDFHRAYGTRILREITREVKNKLEVRKSRMSVKRTPSPPRGGIELG